METKVYLALGSNMGDKKKYLEQAINLIKKEVKVTKISSFFCNPSYGPVVQDDFINAVIEIVTELSALQVLNLCNEVEQKLNRVRSIKWGPRTIDVDILLYGNKIINTEKLTVPHYDMLNRDFVLIPLSEIAPSVIHPIEGKTILELKDKLPK